MPQKRLLNHTPTKSVMHCVMHGPKSLLHICGCEIMFFIVEYLMLIHENVIHL